MLWRSGPALGPELGPPYPDFDDTDEAGRSTFPLPPEDRLWRHPSELKYFGVDEPWPSSRFRAPTGRTVMHGVAALTGLLAAAVTAGMFLWLGPVRERVIERTVERQSIEPVSAPVLFPLGRAGLDVARVAEEVRPSITRVDVLGAGDGATGSGSGVIFRSDGHVLTNAHVIEDADRIRVILADGRSRAAEVVGTDPLTDIAVLRIDRRDGEEFPPVVLGDTTDLRVGEPAIAIGSPLRLQGGPTVTVGVISATGRVLDAQGSRLFDLVQTDAPIMPGSSGGALLNGAGEVIGITTVIAVSDVGAEGLGFAVPIEIAHDVALDLLTVGEARHGFFGVVGSDIGAEQAAELGVVGGSLVTGLEPDGPADEAGLREGDIIVLLGELPVETMSQLIVAVRRLEPGRVVPVTLLRDGEEIVVDVEVATRPE
jgi:S1-C subfamily serine protease